MSPSRTNKVMAKRAPGRPTQSDAVELRERILAVALEEFLAKGFGAASIEGIARAAGVNKDTLYRQFGGKDRLYRESVLHSFESVPRAEMPMSEIDGDVEATLAAVMRRLHRTLTTPRALAVMSMTITQAALFPDLATTVREDTREYLRPLADYLRKRCADGSLDIADPEDAAEMFSTAAMGGMRFMYEPPLRGKALDEFVRMRLDILLRGWKYRPATPARRPARRRST